MRGMQLTKALRASYKWQYAELPESGSDLPRFAALIDLISHATVPAKAIVYS